MGVCQTCHVPIYHGEAIYTPRDYDTEGSWHAEGGGVVSGSDGIGVGAGGVQGGDKRHSVSENWVQCGFCFQKYHEELEVFKSWNKKHQFTSGIVAGLGAIISCLIGYFAKKESFFNLFLLWIGGGAIVGLIIGNIFHYVTQGRKPDEPNRYKMRVKERRAYDLKRKSYDN